MAPCLPPFRLPYIFSWKLCAARPKFQGDLQIVLVWARGFYIKSQLALRTMRSKSFCNHILFLRFHIFHMMFFNSSLFSKSKTLRQYYNFLMWVFKILVLTLLEETNQAIYHYIFSLQTKVLKQVKKLEKTKLILKLVRLVKCWFFRYVVAAYVFSGNVKCYAPRCILPVYFLVDLLLWQ